MLTELLPHHFFDLSSFDHVGLFSEKAAVWEALKNIGKYLEKRKLGQMEGKVASGAILIHPEQITLGKNSIIEAGAYVCGPCIIGDHCEIRHGAYLRGNVITGNGCVIGHATEVKNSIFLDKAHAGHFAYVGDTILGNRVNLGAGAKCANLRFNQKPIGIVVKDQHIETGLRKLGAIVGDDVQIGCNSVTNPGTFIGRESRIYPCINVGGFIGKKSIVKSNAHVIITSISS